MTGRYFFLMCLMIAILSCDNDAVNMQGVDDSEEYFPLQVGRYIEYQVDSIVFDDAPGGNTKDTSTFLLREEVKSLQVSGSGDTIYTIHRLRRNNQSQQWVLKDVWTSYFDEHNALRNEENLIFRKMTHPVYEGLRWIATAYINPQTTVRIGTENLEPYEYWESRVLTVDDTAKVGSFTFADGEIMKIIQTDSDDDLMKRYVHETYARGIGLVARRDSILDSRCIDLGDFGPCIDKAWIDHASKGYILSQVMIGHN